MEHKRVGVFPARERAARRGLFDALEQVLPVCFEGSTPGDAAGLDAAVVFGDDELGAPPHLPRLTFLRDEGSPAPLPGLGQAPITGGPVVALSCESSLDRRIRSIRLCDASVSAAPALDVQPGDLPLASRGNDPVWLSRSARWGVRDVVAVAPLELDTGEALRDRLRNGRFLSLVALIHFLRKISGELAWSPPAVSACFLFDDPNLHWPSYGFVRYRDLLKQADAHGYHVAFATIPLDAWFFHAATARMFRERADRFSLVIHGNNHVHRELAQPLSAAAAQALARQALSRMATFERRSSIPVGRIMVPPHGVCSREMARALASAGFSALCVSRPYPWLARPPHPWLRRPEHSSPVTGWQPASVVENGLPVLLRRSIGDPPEDLALRAFLDQPLIVQAHHDDVRDGLDRLGQLADSIGGLGPVQWRSLASINAANFATRVRDATLHVRLFTREADVSIPEGVERVEVDLQGLQPGDDPGAVTWAATSARAEQLGAAPMGSAVIPVQGAGTIKVRVLSEQRGQATRVAVSRLPLRPVARRFATESRDRLTAAWASGRRLVTG